MRSLLSCSWIWPFLEWDHSNATIKVQAEVRCMVLMALSNKMIARYLLLNKTGGVLMRVDCGHWTDTSSICHTVCQQQAPQDDDDDGVDGLTVCQVPATSTTRRWRWLILPRWCWWCCDFGLKHKALQNVKCFAQIRLLGQISSNASVSGFSKFSILQKFVTVSFLKIVSSISLYPRLWMTFYPHLIFVTTVTTAGCVRKC